MPAPGRAKINASEDARIARHVIDRAKLMLLVVDAHPRCAHVGGSKKPGHIFNFSNEVKCRSFFPGGRFSKAKRAGILHGLNFCEANAAVGGVVKPSFVERQPEITFGVGHR